MWHCLNLYNLNQNNFDCCAWKVWWVDAPNGLESFRQQITVQDTPEFISQTDYKLMI